MCINLCSPLPLQLVTIGSGSLIEFESQISTSEIKGGKDLYIKSPTFTVNPNLIFIFNSSPSNVCCASGFVEFRPVVIGDNVKLGVRSVLLGGSIVASGCEVLPKSALDFYTQTTRNQIIGGSPATVVGSHTASAWRPKRGAGFLCLQLLAILGILMVMALIAYVGVAIGLLFQSKFGALGLVAYLGAIFST